MKLSVKIADRTYTLSLTQKTARVTKKVERNPPAPLGEFRPNRNYQIWLLNNSTDKELQHISDNTYGCIYGKCDGCNRNCGANDIRDLLANPIICGTQQDFSENLHKN